jgi:hypothetical protein
MEILLRLPFVVRLVTYAATAFALGYLGCLTWDFDRLSNGDNVSRMTAWLVVAALIAVVAAIRFVGADTRLHRNFGSIDRFVVYRRALRGGDLPRRIDPNVWRGWLRLSRGSNRVARLLAYLVLAFVVVPSLIRHPVYHPVFASLAGLLASWRVVALWRQRGRIMRVAADVEDRAGSDMTPEQAQLDMSLRLPLAARISASAATGFVLAIVVSGLDRVYTGSGGPLGGILGWAAVVGVVAAVRVVVGTELRLPRGFDSLDQYIGYARALRSGKLPVHIETGVWGQWLSTNRRSNRMEPLWACLLVVLGVLPSVISQSAYWLTGSYFGLLAIRKLVHWWQTRAQISRLVAELEPRGTHGVRRSR